MCYVNPFTDPIEVKDILAKKAKAASWTPTPSKDGIDGVSKTEIIRQLNAMGITPVRFKQRRGFYVSPSPGRRTITTCKGVSRRRRR